ncbi:MAG TPA: tRNA (guanosine(37)-N1)-methyltransferase TrmD [Candidatus Eisenbacteria bacterium]|nr:tRNA (guanosine(37)-N1)-methyltransferase TrmD [Candidatus Eisenbacteria bacterium]
MRVSILTLNPGFFSGALDEGMIRIARERGILDVALVPIRDFATDRYGTTDDYPYGGGAGMVMKVDTIASAYESVRHAVPGERPRVLVTSPQGRVLDQSWVRELAQEAHLAVVCGRYLGIDERAIEVLGAEEISIGDYVLSGGEPAALVLLDAVSRLQAGVLGDEESARADAFSEALLAAPVYTRPDSFQGLPVPEVLKGGNHEEIRIWRRREALRRTLERRPDLLRGRPLSDEDRSLLEAIKKEEARS